MGGVGGWRGWAGGKGEGTGSGADHSVSGNEVREAVKHFSDLNEFN